MYYVYIIQSINHPHHIYVGCTIDLQKRLYNHNAQTTAHTAQYAPWNLLVYTAFEQKDKAYAFEKYLKSGSGRAFSKKRFL